MTKNILKYQELKNIINNIKNNLGWIKNYSKIDRMFLFFYDIDDIDELLINLVNMEINQILYPLGYNNLFFVINNNIKDLYKYIFNNQLFTISDLLDDNIYNKIIDIIDNCEIDLTYPYLQNYYNSIKSKLSLNINPQYYIKNYIKQNIIYIKNNYLKRISNLLYNDNIENLIKSKDYNIDKINNIIKLNNIVKFDDDLKLKIINEMKIINNKDLKNNILEDDNIKILKIIIIKYINKLESIKKKLESRKNKILEDEEILDNLLLLTNDTNNIINNKLDYFDIIDNEKIKFYINKNQLKKYRDRFLDERDINKLIYDLTNNENFNLDTINSIYGSKNIINEYELTYDQALKYILKIYNNIKNNVNLDINNIYIKIFDYISKQLNLSINEDTIINNFDDISKLFLFSDKDFNNEFICDDLNNELYLELIHPKYYYKKYLEEEILPHQKQGIFGFTEDTKKYLNCSRYYFTTFLNKKDNNYEINKIYDMGLNKLILYCMSKRDNIFSIRYVNNGLLPLHRLDNEDSFFDMIKEINNNDIYLGILEKTINKLIHRHDFSNKMYYYMIYNKNSNYIFLFDHNLICTSNYYLTNPIIITFMEIQQLCFYLNMYCYRYNKNNNYLFFSKYNIFDEKTQYPENLYKPLNNNEFKKVLEFYKQNMTLLKCFKYPGLNINIPDCIKLNYKEKLNNEVIGSSIDIHNMFFETQLYIYENDNCKLTNHTFHKKNIINNYDNMNFSIKTKFQGEYYIIEQNKIIQYYDLLYKISQKYTNHIKILQFTYLYEYLTPYTLNTIDNNNNLLYNDIYEFFTHLNKKYFYSKILINNNIYLSLLLYQPTDKLFPSYYELFYKFFKKLKNSNILEISNTTFGSEALGFLSKQFNLNNNIDIFINQSNDYNNIFKRVNMILSSINNVNKIINHIEKIDNNKKYKLIILSNRSDKYWSSSYNIFASNKIIILNLLNIIKLLEENGNIVMRYYCYITNIQKEIYYLFRKLFKKTKLYIPDSNNLDFLTGGFIIGLNYINNNISFDNIINDIENLNDDIYIDFDKYFEKFNFDNFREENNNDSIIYTSYNISKIYIKNENIKKNPCLYSFYKIEDNEKYNKKLEKYFNKYMNSVLFNLKNIDYYLDNKDDLIKLKLSKAIIWANKFKFDIQNDISYMNFLKDYKIEIINNINLYDNYNIIHNYQLKSHNKSFDKNNFIKKINKLNKKHDFITNYIDTRDQRIYRKVRLDFDPFYLKIKNYIKINLDKKYLNQPFFKLYEMLELYKFTNNKQSFKTFSFCELPGSFIFSLEYFIKTKTTIKDYKWKAQSLNETNIAKLDDTFNMLEKYKNNYDLGPKNNGNLLYDYNLDYYYDLINKENFNLITADCGMPFSQNCSIMSNLESNILLIILKTQKDGIIKIIYPFNDHDMNTIIMIGLIYKYYDKLYFYKSPQSLTSNEFYIIFKNFNNNKIDENYKKILNTPFNNIHLLEKYINKEFYYSFYKIYKKLMIIKLKAIKFKLYLLDRYHIINNNKELLSFIDNYNDNILKKWCNDFNFE